MKQKMRMRTLMTAVLVTSVLAAGSNTWAGTLFWDAATNYDSGPASGGTGTWDTATANWWRTNAPAQNVLWSDPLGQDVASFGAPAGIVSIVGTVNVNQIDVATGVSGYIFTNGAINLTGIHTINPSNAAKTQNIYAQLQGSAGLFVGNGNGTLQLFNTNNIYTGGTTISGASALLLITGDGCLGAVPADASGTNILMTGQNSFGSPVTPNCDINLHSNRTIVITGTTATFAPQGKTFIINGRILSTTVNTITYGNDGQGGFMILSNAANSYPGTNYLGRKSVFRIGVDNALPTGSIVRLATAATAASYYGTFDLNGHNQTVFGLLSDAPTSNGSTPVIGLVANNATGTVATLTVTGTSAFDGSLRDFSPQSANTKCGVLALTKSVGGKLTLNCTNVYSGATTITGGTLALGPGGLISSSMVFSVSAGATFDVNSQTEFVLASNRTLQGNGTVLGNVNAATNSIISPGLAGPGPLTVNGNVTLFGRLAADVNAASGANDLLAVGTNLTLNAASVLALTTNGTFSASQHYTLATYGGALSGTFGSVSNLPSKFRIDYGTGVNSAIRLLGPPGGTTIFLR